MSDTTPQPEKLDQRSHDAADAARAELLRLFPAARTEDGKIDFDRLKLVLGETVDTGRERYGMNWPGKADCFKTIQQPSLGTLRPCREESVDFDATANLIIEGDNLETLKLLQKSYLGKVKMIYIDPPYNTGNDFIYPDSYSESLQTYLEYTGQADNEGRKYSNNPETDGRYHSKWLTMMYPRLFLARNLLCDDGVIFISIDDHEINNLRTLGNEIFGEENWIANLVWEKKKKGAFLSGDITNVKEYIVVYARDKSRFGGLLGEIARQSETYPVIKTTNTRGTRVIRAGIPSKYKSLNHTLAAGSRISSGNMELILQDSLVIKDGKLEKDVTIESNWIYSQQLLDEYASKGELYITQELYFRRIVNEPREKKLKDLLPREGDSGQAGNNFVFSDNLFDDGWGTNEDGFDELHAIMEAQSILEFPKPSKLLAKLTLSATRFDESAIVLDFFAGSGTTAHAVLELNRQDGGKRKFILVQLPEQTRRKKEDGTWDETAAWKAGFPTIADITKERVRRVIKKLNEQEAGKLPLAGGAKPDRGFKVFKLQSSNFKTWQANLPPGDVPKLEQQLEMHVGHLVANRTAEDQLYEILLKSGYPLTTPMETLTLAGKTVYSVSGGEMLICLDKELTFEAIKAMADRKPSRVICLDEGFTNNDQLKTNAVQTMKTKGVVKFQTV